MTPLQFYDFSSEANLPITSEDLTARLVCRPGVVSREIITEFISDVSLHLMRSRAVRGEGDIIAFASYFRKKSLLRLVSENFECSKLTKLLPRGNAFIICPSNVELILFYNLFVSLICGNHTILKMSKKNGNSTNFILKAMSEILKSKEQYRDLESLITIIQYDNQVEITSQISALCDVRLTWGGDETVRLVRQSSLNALAPDFAFADRFSASLIDAEYFSRLTEPEQERFVRGFFLDVSEFIQQGCSSPRLIFWINRNENSSILQAFNSKLIQLLKKHEMIGDTMERFVSSSLVASTNNVENISSFDGFNHFQLINPADLESVRQHHSGNFLFFHLDISSVENLLEFISKKDQTLSVAVEDIHLFSNEIREKTNLIDRIVKFGEALNFDYIWDGLNLFECLSKRVRV